MVPGSGPWETGGGGVVVPGCVAGGGVGWVGVAGSGFGREAQAVTEAAASAMSANFATRGVVRLEVITQSFPWLGFRHAARQAPNSLQAEPI